MYVSHQFLSCNNLTSEPNTWIYHHQKTHIKCLQNFLNQQEPAEAEYQQTRMVDELDGHIMHGLRDHNENHVIQKCIECIQQKFASNVDKKCLTFGSPVECQFLVSEMLCISKYYNVLLQVCFFYLVACYIQVYCSREVNPKIKAEHSSCLFLILSFGSFYCVLQAMTNDQFDNYIMQKSIGDSLRVQV